MQFALIIDVTANRQEEETIKSNLNAVDLIGMEHMHIN
jgi:hypothetical protein